MSAGRRPFEWMTERQVGEALRNRYPREVVWSVYWSPTGGYFYGRCASEDQIAIVKPCSECFLPAMTFVDAEDFKRWRDDGLLVTEAFDKLTAEDREQIISGTHPECWDAMFGNNEEDSEVQK